MGAHFIPYNPKADSSYWIAQGLQQLFAGLGQGMARQQTNRVLGQDIQSLQNYNQAMQNYGQYQNLQPGESMNSPQGVQVTQPSFPQFKSPMTNQAMAQGMMSNMFQSPMDRLKMLEISKNLQKPYYQPGIIENAETGEQRPYNYGDSIPKGYKIVKEAQTVVNVGTQPASPAERKEIAETRASIDALNNLRGLFDSTQTKTGPVTGRVSPTAGLFGLTSNEQEAFMAATSAFKNAIIKEITGAQMSEVEANRIMKQVPDITDPPQRWLAKWEQSRKNLEFLQKRRAEVLRQSGLKVPEGEKITNTDLSNRILSDEEINKMSLEQINSLLGQTNTNMPTETPVAVPPSPQDAEGILKKRIREMPAPAQAKINKLTPEHRSRIWERLAKIHKWSNLDSKQRIDVINRIIEQTK